MHGIANSNWQVDREQFAGKRREDALDRLLHERRWRSARDAQRAQVLEMLAERRLIGDGRLEGALSSRISRGSAQRSLRQIAETGQAARQLQWPRRRADKVHPSPGGLAARSGHENTARG